MKKLIVVSIFVLVSLLAVNVQAATVITDWTFESTFSTYTGVIATTIGPLLAETGTGSASGSHAVAPQWSAPAGNGSSHSFSANSWAVGDYYQFQASTTGFSSIAVSWDQTGSNTGPRDWILQYSVDNTTYTTFGTQYTVHSDGWSSGTLNQSSNFTRSGISTNLANAANVYFRLVDNTTNSIIVSTSASGGGTQSSGQFQSPRYRPIG